MHACFFHETEFALRDHKLFEIVEEAYRRHEKVLIFAGTQERAAAIDRFLWVLKQEAFIPHKMLSGADDESEVPVGIVTTELNPARASVLIADGHCTLDFAAGFKAVHEFVDRSTPERHEACRRRFRAYRALQVPVEYLK